MPRDLETDALPARRIYPDLHTTLVDLMYHLLKGLHEYLTRSDTTSGKWLSTETAQKGRILSHYYWFRRCGEDCELYF